MERLCGVYCAHPNLDLCRIWDPDSDLDLRDHFAMTWRFAPMMDPLVSEWHSRDIDARLSMREESAVTDWKRNSAKLYHGMRDHPQHGTAVMGGMFGMRLTGENRKVMRDTLAKILAGAKGKTTTQTDQSLLSRFLWPVAKHDMVVHDSYLCKRYPGPDIRPFPMKRNSSLDFKFGIGNIIGGGPNGRLDLSVWHACPVECRPKNHQDWLLC